MKFSKQLGGVAIKLSAYVAGVVFLCYVAVSILTIKAAYDSLVEDTYQDIETAMDWALDLIDSQLDKVETVTDAIANDGARFRYTQDGIDEYMIELMASCEEISAVTMEYLPGIVPGKAGEYAPTVYVKQSTNDTIFLDVAKLGLHYTDENYKDDNWLRGLEGKSVWSSPYRSVSDSVFRVSYSSPVYDYDGNIFAVLCSTLSLDFLRQAFNENKADAGCELSVITSQGDYIYKQDSLLTLEENALNDAVKYGNQEVIDITQRMMRGEKGTRTVQERYIQKFLLPLHKANNK